MIICTCEETCGKTDINDYDLTVSYPLLPNTAIERDNEVIRIVEKHSAQIVTRGETNLT